MAGGIIIRGNAVKEMNRMPPGSVDLIFADPPYFMRVEGSITRVEGTPFEGCYDEWDQFDSLESYERFTDEWLKACYRVLKPNGSIWVIGGMQCVFTIGAAMQHIGFWLINDVVWHKKNPTPNFMGTRLNNSHETLIWAVKSKNARYTFHYKTAKELNTDALSEEAWGKGARKQLGSVWRFPVCSGSERLRDESGAKLHSAQKPQQLLERILAISSNLGDVVLDPFAGTMTTAAAAKRLGRSYIMIEASESYCEYGQKRLAAVAFEDSDIARATFDIKPLKVSVPEMIASNVLIADEWFSFQDGKPVAQLLQNGKLLYEGSQMDMHACAALAKGSKAKRLNGFDYWYVVRNEIPVSISDIRNEYRASIEKSGR